MSTNVFTDEMSADLLHHVPGLDYALRHHRVTDGAEAIYDQALINGLAAIVAHRWPSAEMHGSGRRAHAARALLEVIKQHGTDAGGGIVHVVHDLPSPTTRIIRP